LWTVIDSSFQFIFSLFSHSYVMITKSDGEVLEGYFKGLHRTQGAISLADNENILAMKTGIGARTLVALQKYQVDRLGRRYEVRSEARTWHGVACT
jgi:CRISPR-associated endonuclease Csn1